MSERRTIHGEVPDGVADRTQGYTHNPNPDDELAVQRARFAEQQQQLQEDRQEVVEYVGEMQDRLGEQYEAAQQNPDHQAFIPVQEALVEQQPMATHGGQFDTSGSTMPETIGAGEMMRQTPRPVAPPSDALGEEERA
jgi:hypothetical protein